MNIHLHYGVGITMNTVILKKNSGSNKAVICDGDQEVSSHSSLEFMNKIQRSIRGNDKHDRWKKAREAGN